jgi:cytochrome c oxidase cbb3-type subunit 3
MAMTKFAIMLSGLISVLVIAPELTPARAAPAAENYRLYCVQCHGTLGNGEGINQTSGGLAVSPRNHAYAKQMSELTDDHLRQAIAGGGDAVESSELMPAWGKTLTGEEIDELVLYLRELCQCEANR